jgi:hypothetical protein
LEFLHPGHAGHLLLRERIKQQTHYDSQENYRHPVTARYSMEKPENILHEAACHGFNKVPNTAQNIHLPQNLKR